MTVLIALGITGTLSLFFGVFKWNKAVLPLVVVGLLAALALNGMYWNTNASFFNNMMTMDNYAVAFTAVSLFLLLVLILFYNSLSGEFEHHLAEVYALMLYGLVGGVVLFSFRNMLMLFLGIEILSISFYILCGLRKRNLASNEAALKYFLMGSFSTGFLLMGMALIYGVTGSLDLDAIANYTQQFAYGVPVYFTVGIMMLLMGMFFKAAAVPFHFWTPDVYDGAPTIVTALMATIGKICFFAAFYLLFSHCFIPVLDHWQQLVGIVAAVSMTVGNVAALQQKSLKRMLAYSSIAHAGYMLMALVAVNELSAGSILFYSAGYGLASLAAFIVVFMVKRYNNGNDTTEAFHGLSRTNPTVALVMAIAMLSLAGIPATAGFFGKFYVFSSAVKSGMLWLVVVAVVNSFIGAYYYLRPVVGAYFEKGTSATLVDGGVPRWLLILLAVLTVLVGVAPQVLAGVL